MINLRRQCFRLTIQDPLLIWLSASKASEYLNMVGHQDGVPAEHLWYRTQAIKVIQERLRDPKLEASDSVINAVAHMSMFEVPKMWNTWWRQDDAGAQAVKEKQASLVAHVNALKRMVLMRGGLLNSGMNPTLQRLVAW